MTVGVLALQGAFKEHIDMLEGLGVSCLQLRKRSDLDMDYDGFVFPGGESTVQGKLLYEFDMLDELRQRIVNGTPVLGTCAGLILLANKISGSDNGYFKTLDVTVRRNAYGRQLGSFCTDCEISGIGRFPMRFIRAPYIESVGKHVEVIAKVDGKIVGVRQGKQIGVAFHPELTGDTRLHKMFLAMFSNDQNVHTE